MAVPLQHGSLGINLLFSQVIIAEILVIPGEEARSENAPCAFEVSLIVLVSCSSRKERKEMRQKNDISAEGKTEKPSKEK
jgi:hypothetical protein